MKDQALGRLEMKFYAACISLLFTIPVNSQNTARRTAVVPINNLRSVQIALPPSAASVPDVCATLNNAPSPLAHTTFAQYFYSAPTHVDNLYVRLWVDAKNCGNAVITGSDRNHLTEALSALGIATAKSFAATVVIKGSSTPTLPTLTPFSFSVKNSDITGEVSPQTMLPWQANPTFNITINYQASQSSSFNTAQLFTGLAQQIAGAGAATALLSPAASAYLGAASTVANDVNQAFFDKSTSSNIPLDFNVSEIQPEQHGPDQAIIVQLLDTHNKLVAGFRIGATYRRTLAESEATFLDPTSDDANQFPQFTGGLPDLLSVEVGAPITGYATLLQQISSDKNFSALIGTSDPHAFKDLCNRLESDLKTNYGLNTYDTTLAMAEILQEYTTYFNDSKLFTSGCFQQHRPDLAKMGIAGFDKAPSQ